MASRYRHPSLLLMCCGWLAIGISAVVSSPAQESAPPTLPGAESPEALESADDTVRFVPAAPMLRGQEAADKHQYHHVPFEELKIASGRAPARVPSTLVGILDTGRFRSPYSAGSPLFSPDGKTLVTGGRLRQWDLESGTLLREFTGIPPVPGAAAFSSDGRLLAWLVGHRHGLRPKHVDTGIAVWNGREERILTGSLSHLLQLHFSPDAKWLVTVRDSGDMDYCYLIDLWNVATGEVVWTYGSHGVSTWFFGFGQRGTLFAAREGGRTAVMRLDTQEELRVAGPCIELAIGPDEKTFAYITQCNTVRIERIEGDDLQSVVQGPEGYVNHLTYSRDSRRLAIGCRGLPPCGAIPDRYVRIWDVVSGEERHALEFGSDKTRFAAESYGADFAFSPNEKRIVLAGRGRMLRMYDVASGRLLWELPGAARTVAPPEPEWASHAAHVTFGADGRTLLLVNELRGHPGKASKRVITLYDAATGKEVVGAAEVLHNASYAAYSLDGGMLAVVRGTEHTRVALWRIAEAKELFPDDGHAGAIRDLCFSPDGRLLASCAADDTIKLWDVAARRPVHTLSRPKTRLRRLAFSPDGERLASGGDSGYAQNDFAVGTQMWDVATGRLLHEFPTSWNSPIRSMIAFTRDGAILAIADGSSPDVKTRFWDMATGDERLLLDEPPEGGPLAFSPDGRWFATRSKQAIHLWDLADRKKPREINTNMDFVAFLVFSPDGARFAAGNRSNVPVVGVWDTGSGQELFKLKNGPLRGTAAFTPDGKHLAMNDSAGNLRILDAESGDEVATYRIDDAQHGAPAPFAFSPTGRHVAVGLDDGTIHVHRLPRYHR